MKLDEIKISEIIRILAVAPYEDMGVLLNKEASKYPEIKLDVVTGNLDEGVELAQANFHADYDIILSRGGTAQLLKDKVDLPIIEIPISFFDILKAVQLSANSGTKRAVVGFPNITENVRMLNDLLNLDLDIYTLDSSEDIDTIIPKLKEEAYQAIICDVISCNSVLEAGLNAILITSGVDSIDEAFDLAMDTAKSMRKLRLENHFLRSVLREHSGETVVFNNNNDLYFSSFDDAQNQDILALLKSLIPEVHSGTAKHVWKSLKGVLYSITSSEITIDEKEYIAYFFTTSRAGSQTKAAGITYLTAKEAEHQYSEKLYHLTGEINQLSHIIESFNLTNQPIFITGENGTGKTTLANYIYVHSQNKRRSIVEIDCALFNDKTEQILFNPTRSPLYTTGVTIHFKNLEQCNEQSLSEIIKTLDYMSVCDNCHVMFSCTHALDVKYFNYIKDKFNCYCIELSPLRDSKEQIPAIANVYLTILNSKTPNDIFKINRSALTILQNYDWPGNYTQFERILSQAAILSDDHMIHDSSIRLLLSQESYKANDNETYSHSSINLNQPLDKIEIAIINQVLKDNGGNQSAAAKQLGIGRTTLWRILNSK